MLEIKEIDLNEYYFAMFGMRTGFTDYCAKCAAYSGGHIFAAFNGKSPAGFICFGISDDGTRLLCALTEKSLRGQGIFTALLAYGIIHVPHPIKVSISEEHKCFAQVSAAVKKENFVLANRCVIFGGDRKDFPEWEKYMEKSGSGLCAYLERRGFSAVSFSELTDEALEYIKNSPRNEFANELSPKDFFDNPAKKLDNDSSFAALKEGKPEAYVLISRPDKDSFIFELICASKKYASMGVILLPFAYSMKAYDESGCRKIRYAMYEDNVHANAFRKKLLGKVTSTQKYSDNFILKD